MPRKWFPILALGLVPPDVELALDSAVALALGSAG